MELNKDAFERLELAVKTDTMPIPADIMNKLRERYGLAAEYMAKILSMSETELREFQDETIKQTRIDLSDEIKSRKQLQERYERHHHHMFQKEPCESYHMGGYF